jgi:hypothetical protein
MPGYIENALIRFSHELPNKPQLQPHPHMLPNYGAAVQYAKADEVSPLAANAEGKHFRQVIGSLLYYGRAVDSTILISLSSLVAAQSKPTPHTLSLVKYYTVTNPDAILTYKKSNMVLAMHSNASYLRKPSA